MKSTLTILILLIGLNTFSQTDKEHYIGVNLLQLPASTLNINYSVDVKPFFTPMIDIGYAFGYNEKYDFAGRYLTRHIDLYDGYTIEKQSGGYIKIGGFFNLRKDFDKNNFPHLGIFITNSLIHEEGMYLSPSSSMPYEIAATRIVQDINILGLNTSIGYEFKLTNRLKTNIDFQLSFPSARYLDLFSYNNFIPGMGYKDTESNVFPMLIFNLKYRL